MKRALSFGFGSALLLAGLYGVCHSLFLAEEIPIGVLSGACFYGLVGSYWLWADLLGYSHDPQPRALSSRTAGKNSVHPLALGWRRARELGDGRDSLGKAAGAQPP